MEVSTEQYLEEMQKIQTNLLDFLDHEENLEEKYQNLINIFNDLKIHDNYHMIKSLFYLILNIFNNHHRESAFFTKIEKILHLFKEDMKKYFSNAELFHIFKRNKRLLLFLLEENLMTMDEQIVKTIIMKYRYLDKNYPQYFQPEIQPFINEKWFPKYVKKGENEENVWVKEIQNEIASDFYEKRKNGENDDDISKLIQKDSIGEFITYIEKNFCSVTSEITPSIYETNNFLLKFDSYKLIEYAAFYGSIQIFNYLRLNGAKIDKYLLVCAIHGRNEEMIHLIEESLSKNKQKEEEDEDDDEDDENNKSFFYEQVLKESFKCHHNEISNYIQENYIHNEEIKTQVTLVCAISYYNFMSIQNDFIYEDSFCYLCKYDYYLLVVNVFNEKNLDINKLMPKWAYYKTDKEYLIKTALYAAVEKQNIEIVKLLLTNDKIEVNGINREHYTDSMSGWKKTALYTAVKDENIEIVKLLLTNKNIDVNIINMDKDYKPKISGLGRPVIEWEIYKF